MWTVQTDGTLCIVCINLAETYINICLHSCYPLFSLCFIGVDNFYDGVEDMIGYRPNPWMKWSWTIITPVLCMVRDERQLWSVTSLCWMRYCRWHVDSSRSQLVLKEACVCFQGCFIFSLVKYKPLTYNKVYEYPDWAIGLGWCLALCSMICIPMVMVIKILQSEGPLIEVSRLHPSVLLMASYFRNTLTRS